MPLPIGWSTAMSADPADVNTTTREVSEFGSGIVVCLAKFSEHLRDSQYQRILTRNWWAELDEEKRQQQRAEAARYPIGDAARRLLDVRDDFDLSGSIELWMNGASDHFYDLAPNAPDPLKELAALTLRIGHGFTGETWTMGHVERIRELWQASCLAVDAMLGVEADWGSW